MFLGAHIQHSMRVCKLRGRDVCIQYYRPIIALSIFAVGPFKILHSASLKSEYDVIVLDFCAINVKI